MISNLPFYNIKEVSYSNISEYGVCSSFGSYIDLNDYFNFQSFELVKSDKVEIFDLFKNEVFFTDEDNKIVAQELKSISIERKNNIFSYYDE